MLGRASTAHAGKMADWLAAGARALVAGFQVLHTDPKKRLAGGRGWRLGLRRPIAPARRRRRRTVIARSTRVYDRWRFAPTLGGHSVSGSSWLVGVSVLT
jgi:hypothetical protein